MWLKEPVANHSRWSTATPGGLWVRADASQKRWADYAGRNKIVSAMTVALDGDFPVNAAVATLADSRVYAAKGEKSSVAVSLVNWGSDGISSFDYQYTLAGEEHTAAMSSQRPSLVCSDGVRKLKWILRL